MDLWLISASEKNYKIGEHLVKLQVQRLIVSASDQLLIMCSILPWCFSLSWQLHTVSYGIFSMAAVNYLLSMK